MTDLMERLAADVGGRYVVERELGRGGMATVYLARDLKDESQVAIKVMDPELAAAVGAERFKREIDVVSRLRHPNILGILDNGEAAGTSYYVMPFVKGETLRDRLEREKQLPVEDALHIARQVADALSFAHQQGVVHRDIKPENILLEGSHALVADFGIARAASTADTKTLTKTGIALGTPHYMSPEQVFGEKTIDGRTDQYALACMLHEMLAGMPPFVGPHAQSLMAQHAIDEPPFVTKYRPTTPANVEDAILTGLAKKPADRFATLADFSEALENSGYTSLMKITRLRATQVAPAPVPEPRWKRALPIAAGMVLALAGGAGAWTYFGDANRRSVEERAAARKIAILYLVPDDSTLAPVADGLTESLIERLRAVSDLSVRSRDAVLPFRGREVAADSIGRALDVGRVIVGTVRQRGDDVRVELELRDGASDARLASLSPVSFPRGRVLDMRDSLARLLAERLQKEIGEEVRLADQRASTSNVEAWTLVQRVERARSQAVAAFVAGDTVRWNRLLHEADSMAFAAAKLDARWAAPHVAAAGLALLRAERLAPLRRDAALPWADSAARRADEALRRSEADPDALRIRGLARYVKSRLSVSDAELATGLLNAAEVDLKQATSVSRTQAGAWIGLSRVAYARKNVSLASNYAQNALDADPYLANAAEIYFRTFVSWYDLAEFAPARQWCGDGQRRFPDDPQFVHCRILLLLAKDSIPRPVDAWPLVAEFEQRVPAPEREFQRRYAQIFVAGALGRAGLKDSARRVLERSRADRRIDPGDELMGYEALAHAHMGNVDDAIELVQRYIAEHPDHRAGFTGTRSWWWEPLRRDRRFEEIIAVVR